jgi:hypothetical protein
VRGKGRIRRGGEGEKGKERRGRIRERGRGE